MNNQKMSHVKYKTNILTGILSGISKVLAESKIGIFAVSTFDTDYILTKAQNFEKALAALQSAGYKIK